MDHLIAVGAGRDIQHIPDGEVATVFGKGEGGPGNYAAGHGHVGQLHGPAGEALLHVQVKAHEGKGEFDRLSIRRCGLCSPGVHHVLVGEFRIGQAEGIYSKRSGLGGEAGQTPTTY